MKKEPKTLYLVDGPALLYRNFYGLAPLRTTAGVPTQATYGFLRSLKKTIKECEVRLLAVCWDDKESLRKEEFAGYKAKRHAAPDELILQKQHIKEALEKMGVLQLCYKGLEADDVLGELALRYGLEESAQNVVIISPDKDLLQLVTQKVSVFDPMKNRLLRPEQVEERFGFGPEKVRFFFSLLGDASDGIPGVIGIGAKTATELAVQFDSLDDLYTKLDEVKKDRVRRLLTEGKEKAYLSSNLFALKKVNVQGDINQFIFSIDWWDRAYPLFEKLELKSFLHSSKPKPSQLSMFQGEVVAQPKNNNLKMISDEAQLVDLVKIIEQKELVAVDVETTGLDMSVCEVVGVSLAVDSKVAYYVPFGHKKESGDLATEQISEEQVRRILFPLLENSTVKKIFHNGRFDLHFIKKWGAAVRGFDFDTIVAARMLLPEWLKVALKSLSSSLLGLEREVCAEVMRGLKNFSYIGLEKATTYAALDAQQTFQLYEIFCEKFIKEPGLKKLFYSLEMPLSEVLFEMENQGLLLDEKKLEQFGVQVEKQIVLHIAKLDAFLETLPELEGKKINYNSPKQVQHLLFDVLGLKSGRKTTTKQFSTDIKVLEELESVHFVPALIMKYRKLKKLLSTYIKALPDHVNLITGRIHTSLSQIAAATGRLASFNPNLQNIPTELASEFNIRSAFVSAVGKSFISIDYSQIELRVLAHLSKDPVLTEIFLEENDLHALTAGSIFSKDFSDVSKQERNVGKRINFSILYGLSSYSLSKDLKVERKVAQGYVDNFFATYAAVMPWMDALVEKAKEDGFITTLMGRKRFFRDLSDRNKMIAQAARRAAINSVVQGTAAEVLKQAMIELSTALKEKMHDAKMILQVHDELLLEVSDDALADVSSLAKQVLENSVQWNVPIKVCVKIGKNWGEMEPLVL